MSRSRPFCRDYRGETIVLLLGKLLICGLHHHKRLYGRLQSYGHYTTGSLHLVLTSWAWVPLWVEESKLDALPCLWSFSSLSSALGDVIIPAPVLCSASTLQCWQLQHCRLYLWFYYCKADITWENNNKFSDNLIFSVTDTAKYSSICFLLAGTQAVEQ